MVNMWFTIIHKLVENVEQNRISKKNGDAANNCQLNSNFIRML